ncbi:MAG: riboflavin synthase [Candidatus Aminicenantes bacterium]|nr:riboflavin synthase [Candidatus Aminicenantes bacterium]
MFTGIINHLGLFKGYRHGKKEILIEAPSLSLDLEIGESIAVNGVCLSLVKKDKLTLSFNLSPETLQKTNLSSLRPGKKLNLELPLTPSSFLSGHLVTGHIDSQGKVLRITEKRPGKRMTVSFPTELKKYFIPKGSVALNGVSLTIASLGASSFEVELIPITLKNSNLGELRTGDAVNIECDIIGKYMYNWMSEGKTNLT